MTASTLSPPHAKKARKSNRHRQLQQSSHDNCVSVADFFYEIILGVTSFPNQGDCSDEEEAEIAALLQKSINDQLRAVPGTIKTKNKVCDSPINSRRLLLPNNNTESSYDDHELTSFDTSRSLVLRMSTRQKSFIYTGGGRCRFCFKDNYDFRRLLSPFGKIDVEKPGAYRRQRYYRNLLFLSSSKPLKPLPKVADILLCKRTTGKSFILNPNYDPVYIDAIKWINVKETTLAVPLLHKNGRSIYYRDWEMMGPYVPGEGFGAQVDMNHAALKNAERIKKILTRPMIKLPVKDGTIRFELYAFDLPTNLPMDTFLADDPLVIFINGIKLDFSLLISQPGIRKTKSLFNEDEIRGSSFAGITWTIARGVDPKRDDNFAFGPEPDLVYKFAISAPLVVMLHKNEFDIDFMFKPNARAKQYAIGKMRVYFSAAQCEVTGIENSPFEDFQSVVESRLFHKLGVDLAHEFQEKEGHCLQNKIPVVNVHLVEKQDWKYSNPHCG